MRGNSGILEERVVEHERRSLSGVEVEILVRVVKGERGVVTVDKQRMRDHV